MRRIHIAGIALACLCLSTGCETTESLLAMPGTAGRLLEADTTDEYLSSDCEAARSIATKADTLGRPSSTDDAADQSRWDRYARGGLGDS